MSTAQQNAQNISTEIAHREPAGAGSLDRPRADRRRRLAALAQIANVIGNTEFVPKGLRGNKPAIMACLLYGRDQGVPAMIALTEIAVDRRQADHEREPDGRRRRGRTATASAASSTATTPANRRRHRQGRPPRRHHRRDHLDIGRRETRRPAREANWVKYPRQMLWARAVSELCRTLFQDGFLGSVYTVDEIGDTLDKHDDLDAEYAEVSAPSPATPPDGAGSGGSDEGAEVDGAAGVADVSSAATGDVVFDTGKHKGETVAEVAAADPAFLWAAVNYKSGPVKDAIADWLLEHPDTPKVSEPPVDGEQQEVAT
jgi:hypothetical protein